MLPRTSQRPRSSCYQVGVSRGLSSPGSPCSPGLCAYLSGQRARERVRAVTSLGSGACASACVCLRGGVCVQVPARGGSPGARRPRRGGGRVSPADQASPCTGTARWFCCSRGQSLCQQHSGTARTRGSPTSLWGTEGRSCREEKMTGGSCCVTVLLSTKGCLWRPRALAGPLLGTSLPSSGLSFPCLLPPQKAYEFHALLPALRGRKPRRVLPTELLFLNNSWVFSLCQEDTGDQPPRLLLARRHHVHCAPAPTPPATRGLSHTDPSPHRAALGSFPRARGVSQPGC